MAAPAILKIDIISDATKAVAALRKTGDESKSTGSKVGALAKVAGAGIATGSVVAFGKAAVGAALDSQKATHGLEQVFRSMGETTGTAAKSAEDYASALSQKIGVDDDAIMSAQTLLATFSNVSSEAGRQAGMFDRATAAAADMAAAGYGNLNSNAVQLGKALQDPVKGVAALSKSGVTFTKVQKDQIAAMVKSGDMLGAQKIVMKEVEHQVKGTAAATATSQDKMNVAFGETQEAVGNALLPVLEKLAPILQTIAKFVQDNISWLMPFAAVIGVLAVAWNIASAAATLFSVSMWAALWPVLLIIAAIAAVIAIVVLLVKNWDTIKAAALAVWQAVVTAWNAIVAAITGAAAAVWNAIRTAWDWMWQKITSVGSAIVNTVKTAFGFVLGIIQGVIAWIRANWPALLAILTGPIGVAVLLITRNWQTIKNAATDLYNWVAGKFRAIVDVITGVAHTIGGVVSDIADAIKTPINAVIRAWNNFRFPTFTLPEVHILGQTIGGGSFGGWSLPNMPMLQHGGYVARTGLAIVHAGETFSGVGNAGASTIVVNVTTTGLGADAPEIQRQVVQALRGYARRNGALPVAVRSAG